MDETIRVPIVEDQETPARHALQRDGLNFRRMRPTTLLLFVVGSIALVQRIIDSIAASCSFASQELHVTASAGIAVYPIDGDECENLLRNVRRIDPRRDGCRRRAALTGNAPTILL